VAVAVVKLKGVKHACPLPHTSTHFAIAMVSNLKADIWRENEGIAGIDEG
jgi:hypothetical protein